MLRCSDGHSWFIVLKISPGRPTVLLRLFVLFSPGKWSFCYTQLKLHVVALFINNDNHNSFYGAVLTKDVTTKVVVEWLTLLLRIREVPASNLDLETGYSDWVFRGFPQPLQANIGIVYWKLVHECFFQILYNLSFTYHHIIWRFLVWVTERASLNKQQEAKDNTGPNLRFSIYSDLLNLTVVRLINWFELIKMLVTS
jgi:hypothetical protein